MTKNQDCCGARTLYKTKIRYFSSKSPATDRLNSQNIYKMNFMCKFNKEITRAIAAGFHFPLSHTVKLIADITCLVQSSFSLLFCLNFVCFKSHSTSVILPCGHLCATHLVPISTSPMLLSFISLLNCC